MIDTLDADHIDDARPLRLELHRHHSGITVPPGYETRDEDDAWTRWRANVHAALRSGDAELFLHRSDEAAEPDALGFVVLLRSEELGRPVLEPVGIHAELQTLVVVDEARGKGIGAELYERCAEWARSRGASTLHVDTRADNLAGLRFYQQQGARAAFTQLTHAL